MKNIITNIFAKVAMVAIVGVFTAATASGETTTVTASKITSSSASWTGSASETWSVSVNGGATNQSVTNGYAQVGTSSSPSTSITISTSGISGTISSIVVNCAAYQGKATLSATVGGAAFGTQNQTVPSWSSNNGGNVTFSGSASGAIVITMTNGNNGRAMYIKSITVTYTTGGSSPSFTASNVNIAYSATQGSIAYTVNNAVDGGAVIASVKSGGDWFALGQGTTSPISFTCSENTSTSSRTATVTLTYTYNTNQTVTKDVTVTQAGRPNYISEITASGTNYSVIGTVVATNSRGLVIGDGTGYVNYYKGSDTGMSVGDIVSITGTTGTYGQMLQFSSATVSTATSSNYNNTPAVTVLDASAMDAYNDNDVLKLSNYVQFEGALATTSGNNTYYEITVGTGNSAQTARISYPTTAQVTALSALVNKTVRVKGYFAGFSSSTFTVMMESIEEVTTPSISVNPSTATAFSYVAGNGPSDDLMFQVTGSNLTSADISASVTSDYEITANTDYSSSVIIGSGDNISVRLKAGLAKGEHNGTLTLSTEGAQDVTVNLSGSVTGQTYSINVDDNITGGSIEADPTSAEEGATVTLTATPDDAYTFGSWTVLKDDMETAIPVTDNQFTMPSCEVYVSATFNAKPTYAITCVANPEASGTIGADPASAYEGQSVTLTIDPEDGYTLSSVVITKTSDGSATDITVTNNTFTMPGYAVTATATFLSNTFEGSFVKYSGNLTEGDYILVYNNQAMNNSLSNSKLGNTDVGNDISNNTITNPLRSIVWHIAPSSTNGYWTIYNAKVGKYVCGTSSSTNVSLVDSPVTNEVVNEGAIWSVSGTYDFRCEANDGQGTARYLRNNSGSYGNYAAQNGGALTLYKLFVEPDPSAPAWSSLPASNEATVGEDFEINLLEYVSGYPVPDITVESTTADPLLYGITDGELRFTPNVAGSFSFTFTATNSEGTSDSGTLIITATAAEVSTPVLSVDAANVTSNSALVSWTACTDASVYTVERSTPLIDESFESNAIPDGWNNSGVAVASGKEGDGSYCAKFDASGDYFITPAINNPGALSFMYKRTSNTADWSLVVSYASSSNASESDWNTITTIDDASTSWQTYSTSLSITGKVYIRFKDTRSSGGAERYVDLIQITGETTTIDVSGTSYTFKGLSPETTYAARVQVKDAETWSNMITFTTDAATPETKEITISSGAKYNGRYWTTFYDGVNGYKLPTGAQAFKLDDNKLVLLGDNGVVIPKETAVVIISDKASLTLTETNATVTVGDNDLEGSDEAVPVTDGMVGGKIPHVLSIGSSAAIGFFKFTGASIPAGKAYVLVSE